jgi:hypothetical protein
MNNFHPPPYSGHAGSGDANTRAWNEAGDSNDDRAAAGMKHDVDGGVYLRSQNNRAGRPSVFENMTSSASKETEPRIVACWHFQTWAVKPTMSAHGGILLQKSKVAGFKIFRENTKQRAVADSYDLNRVTEVACEFCVRL